MSASERHEYDKSVSDEVLYDCAWLSEFAATTVIVHAAFLRQSEREYFRRLAQELAVPFAIASMQARGTDLTARIARRLSESNDASEADQAVLKSLRSKQEALSTAEQPYAVVFLNKGEGFAIDSKTWENWAMVAARLSI